MRIEDGINILKSKPSTEFNSVSDEIAKFIARSNTGAVFQLSGGMITFVMDSISRLGETRIIN